MKILFVLLFIITLNTVSKADNINSYGLICEIKQKDSKRAPNKKLIYHFENDNVYAVQILKQNSPITINKILIGKYNFNSDEITWEGENGSKTIKYYASLNRLNHILSLEYFFVSGSKTDNSTKKSFFCDFMPWIDVENSYN